MLQSQKSDNSERPSSNSLVTVIVWVVMGMASWKLINPEGIVGGVLFIVVWVVLANICQFLLNSFAAVFSDSSALMIGSENSFFDLKEYRNTDYETAIKIAIGHFNNAKFDQADHFVAGYAYYAIQNGDKETAFRILSNYMKHHEIAYHRMRKLAGNIRENFIDGFNADQKDTLTSLIQLINRIPRYKLSRQIRAR